MKKFMVILLLVTAGFAADSIEEVGTQSIECGDPAGDVWMKVDNFISKINFGNTSYYHIQKRVLQLKFKDTHAKSVTEGPAVPPDALEADLYTEKYPSLPVNYSTENAEYTYQETFEDSARRQFPAELLTVKAEIPNASRVEIEDGKMSHLSINLIFPERRLQSVPFQASGYIHYSLEHIANQDFVAGLVSLECKRESKVKW